MSRAVLTRGPVHVGDGQKKVVFIRHGESLANVIRKKYETHPDHGPEEWKVFTSLPLGDVPITDRGIQQAVTVGKRLRKECGVRSYAAETLVKGGPPIDATGVLQQQQTQLQRRISSAAAGVSSLSTTSSEGSVLSESSGSDSEQQKNVPHLSSTSRSCTSSSSCAPYEIWVSPMRRTIETAQCLFGGRVCGRPEKTPTSLEVAEDEQDVHVVEKQDQVGEEALGCVATQDVVEPRGHLLSGPRMESKILRFDRILPAAREYFPQDFAIGAPCAEVSRYLGYTWHDSEWETNWNSLQHIEDPDRMDILHKELVETTAETVFVVCHWGTILNYIQRFCDNLDRTESLSTYSDYLCGGWRKMSHVDPKHMDLENCAVRVVEFH
ncbi:unnamed protein product [Amoebophrya sp. A25]|nr:unnamed protein product [Amoebophrya sp. A25]|eukprot:GSA25T00009944001.1